MEMFLDMKKVILAFVVSLLSIRHELFDLWWDDEILPHEVAWFALDKSSIMLFLLLLLFLACFLNVRNKCLIGLGCDMAQ